MWSFTDIANLEGPVSASWLISSPARYCILIGNVIRTPAAWLHPLQGMLPLTRGTEAHWDGASFARLDEGCLTTAPCNTGAEPWLRDTHTFPASSRAKSSPVCLFGTSAPHVVHGHRAKAHRVCWSPPPILATGIWLRVTWRFTPAVIPSHIAFEATLHHESKPAENGPVPVKNLESLALSLSHGRLNSYFTGKLLKGTETHP